MAIVPMAANRLALAASRLTPWELSSFETTRSLLRLPRNLSQSSTTVL